MLSEKPVAHDFREVRKIAELAKTNGVKTKVGFTFRYSPAIRYMKDMLDRGELGTPYIYNAYEQNSQWLDPKSPLRSGERAGDGPLLVASLEGYGAPVIDIGHWFMGSDLTAVVGVMRNFVPERMIADTGKMARVNIDDGDIFIGEFASGAICSVQTSFVTVGNYPGIEVRVYGSEGAAIARLVEEFGICETLKVAKQDSVEFVEVEIPQSYYPEGGSPRESWRTLYYANLCRELRQRGAGRDRGQRGQLRRRALGAGSHQRGGDLPPRAALGEPAAGRARRCSCSRGSSTMTEQPVRWGIVGTANIARGSFLPGLRAAGGTPAAVAGRDLGRAEKWAGEQGVDRAIEGYQALIDDPDIDALYIPLPNSLHAEWTIAALRAGKPVLCEKPLCGSLEEVQQVLAVAQETGTLLWEAFVFPFHDQFAAVRKLISDGAIGELREIQSNFAFTVGRPENIRMIRDLDGGALNDVAATRSGWPWNCSATGAPVPGRTAPGAPRSGAARTWTSTWSAAWAGPAGSGSCCPAGCGAATTPSPGCWAPPARST